MRVFVTGASGFVGSAIVEELLNHGHSVLGLVRAQSAAERLAATGATPLQGDVNDVATLHRGVAESDAVIHTAFNHDFSQFKANCEADRMVITALGEALAGSRKPLVVTSGIGILHYDRPVTEDDVATASSVIPRAATEEAAQAMAARGVNVYVVRLPPSVHGAGDHGFVPMVIGMAREKGESAYAGDGRNRWPAVHRSDAAALYRLAIERQPELKVFHAVDEPGIPFADIAQVIGDGLNVPVVGKSGDAVADHFGWFAHFAAMDCPASAAKTQQALEWQPVAQGLLEDIRTAGYLALR